MADATTPAWTPPIVKYTGDQAAANPGTYSLNPNIRGQIDSLRRMWSMKFGTPNGTAQDLANMPYGRWQFGNVQAPAGAPAGWGQIPSGAAPGILGQYGANPGDAPTVPGNLDEWWTKIGVPTATNGLLGQQSQQPPSTPGNGVGQSSLLTGGQPAGPSWIGSGTSGTSGRPVIGSPEWWEALRNRGMQP